MTVKRRIATEEAFATPEQMQAIERVITGGVCDADSPFWRITRWAKGFCPRE